MDSFESFELEIWDVDFSNCGFELVEGDMTLTVTAEMEYLTLQFACCGLVK